MNIKIKSTSKVFGWLFNLLNTTPFDGYIFFKVEVNPNYKKGNDILNKIYFKFFHLYFVSRIMWNENYDMARIDLIKKAHLNFGFFVINSLGRMIHSELDVDIEKIKQISALPKYGSGVFNHSKEYVGDIRYAWFWVRQGYYADRVHAGVFFHPAKNHYYGGLKGIGSSFGIGDKSFDENWVPLELDIKWEWVVKFCKAHGLAYKHLNIEQFLQLVPMKDFVNEIPFKERGRDVIMHIGQAKLAARNMVAFLSKYQND